MLLANTTQKALSLQGCYFELGPQLANSKYAQDERILTTLGCIQRVCRSELAIRCSGLKCCLLEHIDFNGTVELAQGCGVGETSYLGRFYNGSTLLNLQLINITAFRYYFAKKSLEEKD